MNKRNWFELILTLALVSVCALGPSSAHAYTQEVTLSLGRMGSPKVLVSIPDQAVASGDTLPVIFVVSGFQTAKALTPLLTSAAGNNIVVVFEYSLDDKTDWNWLSGPTDNQVLQSLVSTPLQIFGALNWVRSPALALQFGVNADVNRISTVSISLGTLFLPSALRLDELKGGHINSMVFAYGGAKLDLVAEQAAKKKGLSVSSGLMQLAKFISSPFEPLNYVKDLKAQNFLVLNADQDQVFPADSQAALTDAMPQPRDVIVVSGPHIGLDQPANAEASLLAIKNWLISKGAVNP